MHNAHLCPELGYFYPDHDLHAGCERLLEAMDTHDAQADAWRDRQRAAIARFLPDDGQVTAQYTALLEALMQQEPA